MDLNTPTHISPPVDFLALKHIYHMTINEQLIIPDDLPVSCHKPYTSYIIVNKDEIPYDI